MVGIRDFLWSTASLANDYAIKPVSTLCFTCYSYGCAASTNIANAMKANSAIENLTQQFQNEDTRSNITHFATNCAKNTAVFACREGLKTVPGGGPIMEIVSRSLPVNKKPENYKKEEIKTLKSELDDQKQKIKELQAVIDKMGKIQSNSEEVLPNHPEGHELYPAVELEPKIHEAYRNQMAAITFFMTKNLHPSKNKQPENCSQGVLVKGIVRSNHALDDLGKTQEKP